MGCPPQGYPPLQEAVAEYLGTSRGVRCAAEQVAIVSGVQQALELVGRVVLNRATGLHGKSGISRRRARVRGGGSANALGRRG